jgi:hypothetical protein
MYWTELITVDDSHAAIKRNGAERHGLPARAVRRVRTGARTKLWDAARLNLGVHGLGGNIKQRNTYHEDFQDSVDRFDFVLAGLPINIRQIVSCAHQAVTPLIIREQTFK